MNNYVLEPLSKEKMLEIFDKKSIDIFKYQLKKNAEAMPEAIIGQENKLKLEIPKTYFEQWCVQALGVSPVGAGSYAIDLLDQDNKWGADVKALAVKYTSKGNLSKGDSGEASLSQKFKETGTDLDSLFSNKNYEDIKSGWLEIVKNKNQQVLNDHKLDHIYYFVFLQGKDRFYLCGMEVFIDNLKDVSVDENRTTKNSVFLKGYLNSNYGNTKIYKAKKRLELRLKPKKWIESNLCIELEFPKAPSPINLREEISEDKKRYIPKIITNF